MSSIYACPRNPGHFLIWRDNGTHWCTECIRAWPDKELKKR